MVNLDFNVPLRQRFSSTGFGWKFPVLFGLNCSVPVSKKVWFGTPYASGFPSHKNTDFLTMPSSTLIFPECEKTSVGVRESSISHKLEELARGEEGVLISGYGVGLILRRIRTATYVKKNQ
jgi:hypothetical protein